MRKASTNCNLSTKRTDTMTPIYKPKGAAKVDVDYTFTLDALTAGIPEVSTASRGSKVKINRYCVFVDTSQSSFLVAISARLSPIETNNPARMAVSLAVNSDESVMANEAANKTRSLPG